MLHVANMFLSSSLANYLRISLTILLINYDDQSTLVAILALCLLSRTLPRPKELSISILTEFSMSTVDDSLLIFSASYFFAR